jgi:hypothetical protein
MTHVLLFLPMSLQGFLRKGMAAVIVSLAQPMAMHAVPR